MSFDKSWERIHNERGWGSYPNEGLVRYILGRSGLRHGSRVLDLGSGQGSSTWFLAREGFCPVAIDGSFSALQKGRGRLEREGLTHLGVAGDLTQLPFAAQSFDAAVDIVSIAHNRFPYLGVLFKGVSRVLKPGGKFFSVLPTNRCSRRTFKGLVTTFLDRIEVQHLLEPHFDNIMILGSSYQLDQDCLIDTWVVTAEAKRT